MLFTLGFSTNSDSLKCTAEASFYNSEPWPLYREETLAVNDQIIECEHVNGSRVSVLGKSAVFNLKISGNIPLLMRNYSINYGLITSSCLAGDLILNLIVRSIERSEVHLSEALIY